MAWLRQYWLAGGICGGAMLFWMLPLVAAFWPQPLLATFVMLPIYLVHQVEEHWHDRFRVYINNRIMGGVDALTPDAVVVINVGGVWCVSLAVLWLAWAVSPGLGLIAVYLVLVNAVSHIGMALARREYNPGVVTALLLFLPVGLWSWRVLAPLASPMEQVIGLSAAMAIHAAILATVLRRRAELRVSAVPA